MWAMAPYTARARAGATPAYSAWKVNTRRNRGSVIRRFTWAPSRPNPPSRSSVARSRTAAGGGDQVEGGSRSSRP